MSTQSNPSCVLFGAGQVRFEDRPVPSLHNADEVIIRIAYVGVCGSDVHQWVHGGSDGAKITQDAPLVMGHEASGIVHAVGSAVQGLAPGDHVAIEPGVPCRCCRHCKTGSYNICPDMRFAADPPTDGTLSRFYKVPQDFVYKIPPSVDLREAVLVEPLAVAVHVARLADVGPGQTVLVQGSGTIGLLAAATAKAFGASRVLIADISQKKLDLAAQLVHCSTFLTDPKSTPVAEAARLRDELSVNHIDVVLECTGVESSIQTAFYALGRGGTLIQVGMGRPLVNVPLLGVCNKEVTIKVSFRYGPGDYEAALQLIESRSVSVKPLISNIVPFDRAAEAWEMTRSGNGVKNLIEGPPSALD